MDSALKGLFGGGSDDEAKTQAKDFIDRYQTGDPTEGYSSEEAAKAFQAAAQHASPEQLQRAAKQAVNQLTPSQREDFAKMLQQRRAGGRESGQMPTDQGAAAATGGSMIQRSGEMDAGAQQGGDGVGLDDILGGILGGGSGGGGLGDILGGLMGGGDASATSGATQQQQGGGTPDIMGGLGDILGSPIGKAIIAGVGAFAMKEVLDKN